MTKEVGKKAKDYIVDWFRSDCHLIALAIMTVGFWATGGEVVGIFVMLGISCVYLWLGSDLKPIITLIMFITMSFSLEQIGTTAFYVAMGIMLPLLAGSLIYNLIRFSKERNYKKGKLFYGMLTAYVAAVLSGITYAPYPKINILIVLGVGLGLYALYFLCVNCTRKELGTHMCKILLYAGFIVALECLIWFFRQPDFVEALASKALRVGWGMSNTLAVVLVMAAPAAVWLGIKYKPYSYVMFPALLLFFLMLLSTLSRGNILFGSPIIATSTIIGIIKSRNKPVLLAIGASLTLIVTFVLLLTPLPSVVLDRLEDAGLNPNGRMELYKNALNNFIQSPIFGVGYFKPKGLYYPLDGPAVSFLWKTHNTILQILSCGGIAGVIGMIPYYVQRYYMLLKNISGFKYFALLAVLAYEMEGMVDVTFLSVHQLFFVFGLLAAAEIDSQKEQYMSVNLREKNSLREYSPVFPSLTLAA